MLHFGNPETRRPRPANRDRWRLWLMFGAACLVLFCMRVLRAPETAQRVDALFMPSREATNKQPTVREVLEGDSGEVTLLPSTTADAIKGETPTAIVDSDGDARFDLSAVRDNTFFRPEESTAWFAVWKWLKEVGRAKLSNESAGEVSYAQLIEQPDVYRGNLVAVRGTIHRQELLDAPANEIGIDQYHRLIVRPAGGGVWPIVVYCLDLPRGFPRDGQLRADVNVAGVFFKNWSYAWEDGLGLAPVVLAQTIHWHPAVTLKPRRANVSIAGVLAVVASAAVIAGMVGWSAWRHTRRPLVELNSHNIVIRPPGDSETA